MDDSARSVRCNGRNCSQGAQYFRTAAFQAAARWQVKWLGQVIHAGLPVQAAAGRMPAVRCGFAALRWNRLSIALPVPLILLNWPSPGQEISGGCALLRACAELERSGE